MRLVQVGVWVACAGALGVTATQVWRLVSMSDCPLARAAKADQWMQQFSVVKRRIERDSRMLRRDGEMQLWETPQGRFWVPAASLPRLSLVLAEQDQDIYAADELVRPRDIVLDCGADIGTFTRKALARGASKVVAIEPAPWKEPCLRRTFATEFSSGRLVIVCKGAWSEDAILRLDVDRIVPGDRGVEVPLTTIDKMVAELQLDRVDLIKMDIEGAEHRALEGARNTIRRFRPRLAIATEHAADDFRTIPAAIAALRPGYRTRCGPCVRQFGRLQPYTLYLE